MIHDVARYTAYAPKMTALALCVVSAMSVASSLMGGFGVVDTIRVTLAYALMILALKIMLLTILALRAKVDLPTRPFTGLSVAIVLMVVGALLVAPVMEKIRPDLFASYLRWRHDV